MVWVHQPTAYTYVYLLMYVRMYVSTATAVRHRQTPREREPARERKRIVYHVLLCTRPTMTFNATTCYEGTRQCQKSRGLWGKWNLSTRKKGLERERSKESSFFFFFFILRARAHARVYVCISVWTWMWMLGCGYHNHWTVWRSSHRFPPTTQPRQIQRRSSVWCTSRWLHFPLSRIPIPPLPRNTESRLRKMNDCCRKLSKFHWLVVRLAGELDSFFFECVYHKFLLAAIV